MVSLYGGAVLAADRIGIATEITSLRKVLGTASERLDSNDLDQDVQSVELLDASREIRGLLNRLAIRLEWAKPVIKDNSELVRLSQFIEEFKTYVNELEDAGQVDDLTAGRRALSLMSRRLTEMEPDAPAPPTKLPGNINVKPEERDDVARATEKSPVVEKIQPSLSRQRIESLQEHTAEPSGVADLIISKVDVSHHLGLIDPGEISVFPYVLNQSSKQVVAPIRFRVVRHEDFNCLLHGGVSSHEERRFTEPCATLPAEIPWPSMTMTFDVEVNFDNAIPESDSDNNLCRVDYRVGFAETDTFPCEPIFRDNER